MVSCDEVPGSGLRFLVLSNMGTHSNGPPADVSETAEGLERLSPRELDVCVLHLAEGWSQSTVAQWLGVSRRSVLLLLASAGEKVPPLRSLRSRGRALPRPRIVHLSQIGRAEQGPFDADDL
jgi:predicted DNA-binding protein (UPF0251 family)